MSQINGKNAKVKMPNCTSFESKVLFFSMKQNNEALLGVFALFWCPHDKQKGMSADLNQKSKW